MSIKKHSKILVFRVLASIMLFYFEFKNGIWQIGDEKG